ncbi:sensor histidine kinase [Pedobacter frigidisoli]|nr:sensor histidine kinase [Pedobacter frigidisoli]
MEILSETLKPRIKPAVVHFICWAAFIFIEVIVAGLVKQRFNSLPYYVLFCSMNIGLFYLHGNFVMRLATGIGVLRMIQLLVLILLEITAYCLCAVATSLILLHIFNEQPESGLKFNIAYFAIVIYRALFFITFGTGFYFLKQFLIRKEAEMQHAIKVEKLENKLLTAQKDYLRAQINPHLLFNTLDFIKAVSKKNPEQSDQAIDCLAEIMDYALETSHKDLVPLDREVEQIEHMIQLNCLRSNNRLNLRFIKKIEYLKAKIIPILLLTLVENVFKHGNLLDDAHHAKMELLVTDKSITFRTLNLIASTPPSKSEHTGLKNIVARLAQSYPGKHLFVYGAEKNVFKTELKINL